MKELMNYYYERLQKFRLFFITLTLFTSTSKTYYDMKFVFLFIYIIVRVYIPIRYNAYI